jgi:hypothetical protein
LFRRRARRGRMPLWSNSSTESEIERNRMASTIDVIVPANSENLWYAIECLRYISENTGVDHNLVLSAQGGRAKDFLARIKESGLDVTLVWDKDTGSIRRAIEDAIDAQIDPADFTAVVGPSIMIKDPTWFGKMQAVFLKTPCPGMVGVPIGGPTNTSAPPFQVRSKKDHPDGGIMFFSRQAYEIAKPLSDAADFQVALSQSILSNGMFRWIHPGVLFDIIPAPSHT